MLSIMILMLMLPPAALISPYVVKKGSNINKNGFPDTSYKAIFGIFVFTAVAWVFAWLIDLSATNGDHSWFIVIALYFFGVVMLSVACYWVRWLLQRARA